MGIYIPTKTKEEHAAYMRNYRANNKDKIKAINKKWWEANKDFIKLKKELCQM
jgi:hypothetical protein